MNKIIGIDSMYNGQHHIYYNGRYWVKIKGQIISLPEEKVEMIISEEIPHLERVNRYIDKGENLLINFIYSIINKIIYDYSYKLYSHR